MCCTNILACLSRHWVLVRSGGLDSTGMWGLEDQPLAARPQSLTTFECGFGMTALIRLEPHEETLLIWYHVRPQLSRPREITCECPLILQTTPPATYLLYPTDPIHALGLHKQSHVCELVAWFRLICYKAQTLRPAARLGVEYAARTSWAPSLGLHGTTHTTRQWVTFSRLPSLDPFAEPRSGRNSWPCSVSLLRAFARAR